MMTLSSTLAVACPSSRPRCDLDTRLPSNTAAASGTINTREGMGGPAPSDTLRMGSTNSLTCPQVSPQLSPQTAFRDVAGGTWAHNWIAHSRHLDDALVST